MKLDLTKQIVIASILGLIAGYFLGPHVIYIKFLGDVFLRLISMVVPILIFGAIVEAVGSLNVKDLGNIGFKTLLLFVVETAFATFAGVAFVNIFKPGVSLGNIATKAYEGNLPNNSFIEQIVNFVPKNVVAAFSEGHIIQIIVFGIILGYAISVLKENEEINKIFIYIKSMNLLIMKIVAIVMKFAPVGIFSLLAWVIGDNGLSLLVPLIKYVFTVTAANIFVFGICVFAVSLYGRFSPIKLIKNASRTIIMSATTSSSAMSLPMNMLDSEERIGISKRISNFVNPLGMSLNSAGGAITIVISCVTAAQIFGIKLSVQNQIIIALYTIISTFGNTLVPGGAIVSIALVFQLAGLPLEGVALIAGVDWFVGITRVVLNVVLDMLCALAIAISENEFNRELFNRDHRIISIAKGEVINKEDRL